MFPFGWLELENWVYAGGNTVLESRGSRRWILVAPLFVRDWCVIPARIGHTFRVTMLASFVVIGPWFACR